MRYQPTSEAAQKPRTQWLNGRYVGIGGAVAIDTTVPPTCQSCGQPEQPIVASDPVIAFECSQEEYRYFFEQGYTHLIEQVKDDSGDNDDAIGTDGSQRKVDKPGRRLRNA